MEKKVILLFIFLVIVSFDQFSKVHVEKTLLTYHNEKNLKSYRGKHIKVIPDFFSISYVRNQGAAWGMGSNMSSTYRDPFFYTMTAISLIFIFFYFRSTRPSERTLRLCLTFIFAGAIGNLIDRIRLKYVIDFLDFQFWGWHFPSFNVADSAITVGVILLIIVTFYTGLQESKTVPVETE